MQLLNGNTTSNNVGTPTSYNLSQSLETINITSGPLIAMMSQNSSNTAVILEQNRLISNTTIQECFDVNGDAITECADQELSPSQHIPYRYTVDLGKWGNFKIHDTYSNRNSTKVKAALNKTISIIGQMFGEEYINDYHIKSHDCTVDISPPAGGYGESGVYPSQNYNNIIYCQIRASSHIGSDYRVLIHEMFHALFNGLLLGKFDSMPRMFTEGFARAAMHYDSEYLAQYGGSSVLNTIAVLERRCGTFNSMSDMFNCLKNSYGDNYAPGEKYFYYCMHTSTNALPSYIQKIIQEPFKSYYSYNAHDLIGVGALETDCSIGGFKQWLNKPDFTRASNKFHDVILACDNNKTKILVCDRQSRIFTPEEVINKDCFVANSTINLFSNNRIIFQDSNGIAVITEKDQGVTFLHQQSNTHDIKKRVCFQGNLWVENKIGTIKNYTKCSETDKVSNDISQAVQKCRRQSPTLEDIALFTTTPTTTMETPTTPSIVQDHVFVAICNDQNTILKVLVCDRSHTPKKTPTFEEAKDCPDANDTMSFDDYNRIMFKDANNMIILSLSSPNRESTVLYKEETNGSVIKHSCPTNWHNWLKSVMKNIVSYKNSKYTDDQQNHLFQELQRCESQTPTPEDVALFLGTAKHTTPSTTTTSTTTSSTTASSTTSMTHDSVYNLPYIKMKINFVHLRSNEMEEVIKNIDITIKKFVSTIGIGQSKFKHEGSFYKLNKEELSKTANYHIQDKYDDIISFYVNSVISDKAIQYAMTQAIIYYITEGNTLLNKKGNYNGFFIEGITSFIEMERNDDLTSKYLECGANNVLNSALKYYNLDQLFELQPTYIISCVGSALLKYAQEFYRGAVFNFLSCAQESSMPELYKQCTNAYFNIDMYNFRSWLSKFRGSYQEHPTIFVYADKSEIFSCTPSVLKEGESKFNNAKDLYGFFYQSPECFTLLHNQLPKDLPVTLYHNSHKIEYSPSNDVFRIVELSVHYPYERLLGEYKNSSSQFGALAKYVENIGLETSKSNYTSLSYLYNNMIDSIGVIPTTTMLPSTTQPGTSPLKIESINDDIGDIYARLPSITQPDASSSKIEPINDYSSYIYGSVGGLLGVTAIVLGGLLIKKVCFGTNGPHYNMVGAVTKGAYDTIVSVVSTKAGDRTQQAAFITTENVHKQAVDVLKTPFLGEGSTTVDDL